MNNPQNCLKLWPSAIGSKTTSMGNETFDRLTLKLKKTPEAKYLLSETENHLKKQYKGIYDGTMQGLSTFPPHYDLGVEIKKNDKTEKGEWARKTRRTMQYVDESLINNRIQQLEKNIQNQQPHPIMEDIREKSHLEMILKEKLPLSTEAKVIMRLQNHFAKYRGLLLHSYKPETYLQRYIELAKDLRKTNNPPALTTFEEDILSLLKISPTDVHNWVSSTMNKLKVEKTKMQPQPQHSFSGAVIQTGLGLNSKPSKERKNQWNELKQSFRQFKTQWDSQSRKYVPLKDAYGNQLECIYDQNEIMQKLYQSEFNRLTTEFNDEFDVLVFLPDQQLILGTEVKQAMTKDAKANDKQTREAAKQTKKRKAYVQKMFGDLLGQGWQYVAVIAMYDNQGNLVLNKCGDCSLFMLTNGTNQEEVQQLQSLMASLTANKAVKSSPTFRNPVAFDSFKHVVSRIIGLSGSLMTVQKLGPYHDIMGTDATDLNAGWTRASPLKFSLPNDVPREGDVFGRPHDVYNLIFYSQDQIGLLSMTTKFVVFLNEYGSGKTLICKEAAIRTKKLSANESYYISLLAADRFGKPKDEYYTFDEASKIDLSGTGVKVLDVHQLLTRYKDRNPDISEEDLNALTVYELAIDLIDAEPKASFFFDECPFIGTSVKWYEFGDSYNYNQDSIQKASSFIKSIREKIDSESRVFIAFQVNPICDITSADSSFGNNFESMKSDLLQDGVHIANLSTNLRNTKDISEVSRNVRMLDSRNDLQKQHMDWVQALSIKTINLRNTANISATVKMLQSGKATKKMTKHIQTLSVKTTNVKSSKPPLLIPILRRKRQDHLIPALKRALEEIKQSTPNVVIMYERCSLSSKEIKESLVECDVEEDEILIHPTKSRKESPTNLIKYLQQPKGIYVVPCENFVGMEANSVLYILSQSDKYGREDSIRCNISRAVSHLSIIMEQREDGFFNASNKFLFRSTEVDPTFVECLKTIRLKAFKCNPSHSNSSSTSPSTSLPLLKQQQQVQETSSTFLKLFKHEKYVCQTCIQVCLNSHYQHSFVWLGGGAFTNFLGYLLSIGGSVARMIKCSIVGESRCSCDEITECLISKNSTDSCFNWDHLKDVVFRILWNMILVIFPLFVSVFDVIKELDFVVIIICISYFMFLLYSIIFK